MTLSESAEGRARTFWPRVCESGHQHFVAVDQPHVSPRFTRPSGASGRTA